MGFGWFCSTLFDSVCIRCDFLAMHGISNRAWLCATTGWKPMLKFKKRVKYIFIENMELINPGMGIMKFLASWSYNVISAVFMLSALSLGDHCRLFTIMLSLRHHCYLQGTIAVFSPSCCLYDIIATFREPLLSFLHHAVSTTSVLSLLHHCYL